MLSPAFDYASLPAGFPALIGWRELRSLCRMTALEERHDLLREALQDSLEDVAMLRAIQAGEKSPLTSRKKIFQRLSGRS